MKQRRVLMLAGAVGVAALLAQAQSSGAQSASMSITPAAGPPGTSIQVSGSGCPSESARIEGATYEVNLVFQVGEIASGPTAGVGHPADTSATARVAGDGQWNGSITVPPNAPAGPAAVYATCRQLRDGQAASGTGTTYAAQPFTVELLPVASPAKPTPGQPRFTG